jgi:hypothetical protein
MERVEEGVDERILEMGRAGWRSMKAQRPGEEVGGRPLEVNDEPLEALRVKTDPCAPACWAVLPEEVEWMMAYPWNVSPGQEVDLASCSLQCIRRAPLS